ncbi:hypothetical protein EV145_112115 [Flavobacterium sp. 245]|nr:hypothetical protein EV145_112115 [Flavobacterium sp. 245]
MKESKFLIQSKKEQDFYKIEDLKIREKPSSSTVNNKFKMI